MATKSSEITFAHASQSMSDVSMLSDHTNAKKMKANKQRAMWQQVTPMHNLLTWTTKFLSFGNCTVQVRSFHCCWHFPNIQIQFVHMSMDVKNESDHVLQIDNNMSSNNQLQLPDLIASGKKDNFLAFLECPNLCHNRTQLNRVSIANWHPTLLDNFSSVHAVSHNQSLIALNH